MTNKLHPGRLLTRLQQFPLVLDAVLLWIYNHAELGKLLVELTHRLPHVRRVPRQQLLLENLPHLRTPGGN